VDRICPFLALRDDHRTAIDGYDPDHACHARRPPEPLDRARQAELCLSEAHRKCEYYVAYLAEHSAEAGTFPMPAADANVARTRLILEADARRQRAGAPASFGSSGRRWLVAGGIAAVGVAVAATAFGGGFRGLVGMPTSSTPAGQGSASPTPTAVPPTPVPTPERTRTPSASPASREPGPTPTAQATPQSTPAPTPESRTYVVQEGDTLSLISTRFGTSVSAVQAANGINDADEIRPGQVLVIP
jgi:LysM repeat protein